MTGKIFLLLKNRLKEPGLFSLQKLNRKGKLIKSANIEGTGTNIKMKEELFRLWEVIVYGHAKINSAYNNLIEKKCAFSGLHRQNF